MSAKNAKSKASLVGILRMLVYLGALLCLAVLAVTGFYPVLVWGEHISGYLVMVHATFAPVFAVCLAVMAVLWASNCRFSRGDWPWFDRLVQRVSLVQNAGGQRAGKSGLWRKIFFWLTIFLALPLGLSIVLSMFPLFGTHVQELLLSMHRCTAIVFGPVAAIHALQVLAAGAK
jgi:cytochrome b subunit of formate dehydrogenase